MWVNHKLRRDCPGNPSKLGVGGPQENGEPRTPSAGGLSPSTWRRQPGWLWRVFERGPGHHVPCPIPA